MMLYVLKRVLLIIPTMIGITLITFLVMKLAPGDPVMIKLMFASGNLSPEALEAQLKSEKPPIEIPVVLERSSQRVALWVHGEQKDQEELKETATYKALHWSFENVVYYFKWLSSIARFDFGYSFKDKRPVTQKILEALPITLLINILSIIIIYTVSIPLGIWSAIRKGETWDKVVMVKLFIFYSLPGFWVASMLLMYLAGGEYLDLFPILGYKSPYFAELSVFQKVFDVLWHLTLPIIASVLGGFAFLSRFSRSNFLDVMRQDYMRTARAKGLSEGRVLFKHGLRNALIPFVTLMATLLPSLLGGSVIIEQIFSIPGMGMLSFEAVLGRDHNVIMGIATIGAFLTLVSLLIADLMYVVVDPRIRLD